MLAKRGASTGHAAKAEEEAQAKEEAEAKASRERAEFLLDAVRLPPMAQHIRCVWSFWGQL